MLAHGSAATVQRSRRLTRLCGDRQPIWRRPEAGSRL